MPEVTTVGNQCTGHDNCAPRKLIEGSNTLFINGNAIGRVGDKYEPHGCSIHSPHQGFITQGAPYFLVDGKQVARVGDPVSCGGAVLEGVHFFNVGNQGGEKIGEEIRIDITKRCIKRSTDDEAKLLLCLPEIADAEALEYENENDQQGWRYLAGMFRKWFSGPDNRSPKSNPEPFWVDFDWAESFSCMESLIEDAKKLAINNNAQKSLGNILYKQGFLTNQQETFDFTVSPWDKWDVFSLPVTGLFAALGTFSLRILAKGTVEPVSPNQYKIRITGISLFIYDLFNFEGDEPLGCWSCKEKKFSYANFSTSYKTLYNSTFNNFRLNYKIGNDFLVLSKPKKVDSFKEFVYIYEK